jgi:hypothetical protein
MKNIFFLKSPLQFLCGIEAIRNFGLNSDNILVIYEKGVENNLFQLQKLLEVYVSEFEKIEIIDRKGKSISGWLNGFNSINNFAKKYSKINNLFIGDYQNGLVRHYQNSVSYKNVYLLDDGFATIHINNQIQKEGLINYKDYLKLFLSKGNYKFGVNKQVKYFTVFNKQISGPNIYPNKFKHLIKSNNWKSQNAIYWLGSPIVEDGIVTQNYYLKTIERWANKLHKSETIIYFPHRRENANKLKVIEDKLGFRIKKIDLPIELYVVQERVKPESIISFFSTALYTLNRIIEGTDIYYIPIKSKNILDRKDHINDIYNILSKEIKNINSIVL